jgi:hypothetical protein
MLFILVMDGLNLLFLKGEENVVISTFPVGVAIPQCMSVYADDLQFSSGPQGVMQPL